MQQIKPAIKAYRTKKKEGLIGLSAVYRRVDNNALAKIPEITGILTAKGITLEANAPVEDV